MTATAAGTSADGPPAKKKRGSSGNPRGVIETSSGKFQGRVNYKPPGVSKGQLRGIGTFDTPEEAGQAVTAAEAKLKAEGPDAVWPEQARTNLHKRGEVRPMPNPTSTSSFTLATTRILQAPPPKRATARRWGVYSTEKSAKANLSAEDFEAWKTEHGTPAGADRPDLRPHAINHRRGQQRAHGSVHGYEWLGRGLSGGFGGVGCAG